jgi:hypothetical protein
MKRPLLKIAALLVIGAALNVTTAWACALAVDIGDAPARELYAALGSENHWEVFRWDRGAGTRVMSYCWNGRAPAPCNPGRPETLLAHWGSIDPPEPAAPALVSRIDEAWGFPMRSMLGRFESRPTADGTASVTRRGVLSLRPAEPGGERGLYLPLIPIWTGFLVNTALYALVVLVACAGVRDLSRSARR